MKSDGHKRVRAKSGCRQKVRFAKPGQYSYRDETTVYKTCKMKTLSNLKNENSIELEKHSLLVPLTGIYRGNSCLQRYGKDGGTGGVGGSSTQGYRGGNKKP